MPLTHLQAKGMYTFILILSSKDSQEDYITGMDAGADDFITKPFNSIELRLA